MQLRLSPLLLAGTVIWSLGLSIAIPILCVLEVLPFRLPIPVLYFWLWLMGPALAFSAWAVGDAQESGRSRRFAIWHVVPWLVVPFLPAIPYFLSTRGLARGTMTAIFFLLVASSLVLVSLWLAFAAGSIDAENLRGA